jgi:hypothetical protein
MLSIEFLASLDGLVTIATIAAVFGHELVLLLYFRRKGVAKHLWQRIELLFSALPTPKPASSGNLTSS